jgi:glyoxylase-like metal-dependent hydrolase (beta-lactamase superfamily II)
MATAAEPRPAELPLPGGRPGASVRVHPLLTGTMTGPEPWFLREEGRLAWRKALGVGLPKDRWLEVPVPAFLVEHPSAGPVLIDTGFHPSVAVSPAQSLGRLSGITFRDLRMDAEQAASAQLRAKGIPPADVRLVVMTHLHIDHASAISEFPNATFVVSSAEWEAASSGRQLDGYVKRQFDHGFEYRLLDFDSPETSSFAGFGRSFDLLADGTIRCVFTPGHTWGHMSVVLRLSGRELLVAGDAIYLRRTLDEMRPPYRTVDDHVFMRSLREIAQYAKETPDAVIVPGHDWEAWGKLDPLYE